MQFKTEEFALISDCIMMRISTLETRLAILGDKPPLSNTRRIARYHMDMELIELRALYHKVNIR